MKRIILALGFLPIVAVAQDYSKMSQEDMQKMMQQMQKVQVCMQEIDRSELGALEQRGKAIASEVEQLCKDGARDEAQAKALSFALKMKDDPIVQQARKCSAMLQGVMKQESFLDLYKEAKTRHVCD